jgi:D-serine deaminase-like pyridoxal phosphate-dependent protein
MDKLKKFIGFLNDEELDALKKSMEVEWVRDDMEQANAVKAAKEAVRWVMHYYVGLDRMFIITNEQQKRWQEVRAKARELGLLTE